LQVSTVIAAGGTIMEKILVSLDEAANLTGLSSKTLRRRISDGTLPARRVGRLVRIHVDDLHNLGRTIPSAGVR
jgi:excisionase family DNA binding protein